MSLKNRLVAKIGKDALDLLPFSSQEIDDTRSDVNTLQDSVSELQPKNIRTTSSADQPVPAGSLIILDYDVTQYTTGVTDFTVSTEGRITVQNAGVYSITCGTVIEAQIGAIDSFNLVLAVNGGIAASAGSYTELVVGSALALTTGTQVSLSAGDIIDARVIITQAVSGVGNGLIRRVRDLFGATATQVNHLAVSKIG